MNRKPYTTSALRRLAKRADRYQRPWRQNIYDSSQAGFFLHDGQYYMSDGYSAVWFDPPPPEIPVVDTNPALKRLGGNIATAFRTMETKELARIDPLGIDTEELKTELKNWKKTIPLSVWVTDSTKINAQYLLDMLDMIRDCEIYVSPHNRWSPVYFKNDRAKGLIMPVASSERIKPDKNPSAGAQPVPAPD